MDGAIVYGDKSSEKVLKTLNEEMLFGGKAERVRTVPRRAKNSNWRE